MEYDRRKGREVENAVHRVDDEKENNEGTRQSVERAATIPVISNNISATATSSTTTTAISLNNFSNKEQEMTKVKNSTFTPKKIQNGPVKLSEKEERRETVSLIHQGRDLGSMEDSDVESDSGQSSKPSPVGFSLLDLIIAETENDYREISNLSSINQLPWIQGPTLDESMIQFLFSLLSLTISPVHFVFFWE